MKIWEFVRENIWVVILSSFKQQLTMQLIFQDAGDSIISTIVYTKCLTLERLSMWDDIYSSSHNMRLHWLVGVT